MGFGWKGVCTYQVNDCIKYYFWSMQSRSEQLKPLVKRLYYTQVTNIFNHRFVCGCVLHVHKHVYG